MPASSSKERLAGALTRVIALRQKLQADQALAARWLELKRWQVQRLRRTYADLFAQPRYAAAGDFFLTSLYGAKDFEQRDREALKISATLAHMLPERAVDTIALAVELDELSEILDAGLAAEVQLPIDDEAYAAAYRAAGTPSERQRQIEMVDRIGRSLQRLARLPGLAALLSLMRAPAGAAGLDHLHQFLQTGFHAFKEVGSATEFLDTIKVRESELMRRLFAREPRPFRDLGESKA